MSAESSEPRGRFTYWRLRFRAWRGTRPFWAGLLTLLSGVPIAYFPYAELKLGHLTLTMATTAGAGSLIIGVLLATLGLTMWFQSIVRVFAGVATILLGLVSIPVSNIGGFMMGATLALIGGGLSIAWAPGRPVDLDDEHAADVGDGRPAGHAAVRRQTFKPGGGAVDQGTPDGGGDDPFLPGPHDGRPNLTDTTAHANGGRNSAG
ncbi:DUF6114 domain-containing protein [Streptomyces sp. NPDC058653]|uniref:DUF6114 domain-containing protein n=1 Tax=Streptomyces sp. NPDC058653 TaxID=3346576 RepID=UPI0036560DB2